MTSMENKEAAKKIIEGINIDGNGLKELNVRIGDLPITYGPQALTFDGTIDAPLRWLRKRADALNPKECFVVSNRENMMIVLIIREKAKDCDKIHGILQISPEMKRFDINGKNRFSNFDMARLFKMNRSFFETKAKAMELVTTLQNFKAKIDKEMEKCENGKGDRRLLLNQTVQSNLPDSFTLNIPIFKGRPKEKILVEVDIDPDDFSCALISPDAADRIEELKNDLMDEVLHSIEEEFPGFVIVEE